MSRGAVQVGPGRPDHPQVRSLLDALDAYLGSLYAPEDNHIFDLAALQAPEVDFLVAEADGRIVGCGATRRMPGEPATGGRPYGEVKRMMVEPACRGRGVGGRLLSALEVRLAAAGIGLALLETGRDQREAVALYEGAGYRRRGAFAGYPDNGRSLFYEKTLDA